MLALLALALVPFGILLNAFVLTQLWHWFVVPFGIMTLSMAHAYGIAILIRLFTYHHNYAKEKTGNDALVDSIIAMFMAPLFAWGFGAIAHSFM
jgi:mannose/fructose/N-acetylgalactosamine-specific phosphotransferase system component IIC